MKKIGLTLNLSGVKAFSLKPIQKEDRKTLRDYGEAESAWWALKDRRDYDFYFAQVETPVESYYVEDLDNQTALETNDEDFDDEDSDATVVDDEYTLSPQYGIEPEEDIRSDYEDDEDELKTALSRLMDMEFVKPETDEAKAIVDSWKGLQENDVNEESFLPSAMTHILMDKGAKEALLKFTSVEDFGGRFSQFGYDIEIGDDEEFDINKVDFIDIDAEYGDESPVLSDNTMDMVCLNAIIYDGKMYFAKDIDVDFDGADSEEFDLVDEYIETKDFDDIEEDEEPEDAEVTALKEEPEEKRTAICGEYIITQNTAGTITVYRIFNNVKESLRDAAVMKDYKYEEKWNTRQFGSNLCKEFGNGKSAQIGPYYINKLDNGAIETYRTFGNTKDALRKIADKIGYTYEAKWNTRTLGAHLINEINKNK